MRSHFDEQLALLHREIIAMGALCERAIALSSKDLEEGKTERGGEVFAHVAKIKSQERDIEALCLRLLLQQQPVAKDLRAISAALKMVTDMERIGDNSGDIAEIVALGHITPVHDKLQIGEMASATVKMVTESIDAFVKNDVGSAKRVIAYDDVVDSHFDRIKRALIEVLRSCDDGEYALDLLMIAKYLERIGDHAVNIAGWVIFSITGKK